MKIIKYLAVILLLSAIYMFVPFKYIFCGILNFIAYIVINIIFLLQ